MHYKNGREAKAGDRIIDLQSGMSGILHSTDAKADCCNGRMARTSHNDPYVITGCCLHLDDVAAMAVVTPDVSNRPH